MKKIVIRFKLIFFICILNNLNIVAQIDYGNCYNNLPPGQAPFTGFPNSSTCNLDVFDAPFSIPEEILNNMSRSVVRIGPFGCSATILAKENNGNPTPDYYILTARHCIHYDLFNNVLSAGAGLGPLVDLSSIQIVFNGSKASSSNFKPCDINHSIITTLTSIEQNLTNDMALLKIEGSIPPHFKTYFAGWSASFFNTNTFSGDFHILHHPKRDVKKVTIAHWYDVYDAASSAFFLSPWASVVAGSTGFTDRIYADLDAANGLLENGSSGSCIINGNDKVIATYSAGLNKDPNCNGATRAASFGKFRKFYLSSQNVRQALGVSLPQMSLSGKELTCYNNLIGLKGNHYAANTYQPNNAIALNSASVISTNGTLKIMSGANFTFTAQNEIELNPGFETENNVEFTAELAPCVNFNYRMAQPQEEFMTAIDSLYMDSLIVNNITPFKEDSAAWFNIMEAYYPHILQNKDSLELYWSYLGYGLLNQTNTAANRLANVNSIATDYVLSNKSIEFFSNKKDIKKVDELNPSLKTLQSKLITIYPNPNNGEFLLELSNLVNGIYNLQITDALGRSVIEQTINVQEQNLKQNINLQAHGKGVYFVKINSEQLNEVRKVVVE